MKVFSLTISLLFSLVSFGASKTIVQCAVNKIEASEGARVNLLQTEAGEFKANLIFGTTVSGQSFQVNQVSPGVFVGSIRNKQQFPLKLVISSYRKSNPYVDGYQSSLEAIYPDMTSPTGVSSAKTKASDDFVCGKIISRF